jgi:hypothetical protein
VRFALHAGPVMEYEVALTESLRVRLSLPRMQAAATWREGDRVAVSIVDPGSTRVFPPRAA